MLRVKKKIAYLCLWLVGVLLCACSRDADEIIVIGSEDEMAASSMCVDAPEELSENLSGSETIFVYVCGAVNHPGVVEIPEGSRAEDALEAAGGFGESACLNYVNLADWVEDGQMLYFPTEEEVASGQILTSVITSAVSGEGGLVNINTADAALLCTLPGIGERRAADIIAYRQTNGFFQSCEDIMSVPGIKTGLYEKICDRITVD